MRGSSAPVQPRRSELPRMRRGEKKYAASRRTAPPMGRSDEFYLSILRWQVHPQSEVYQPCVRQGGTPTACAAESLPELRQSNEARTLLHTLCVPAGRRNAEFVLPLCAVTEEPRPVRGFFRARDGPHPFVAKPWRKSDRRTRAVQPNIPPVVEMNRQNACWNWGNRGVISRSFDIGGLFQVTMFPMVSSASNHPQQIPEALKNLKGQIQQSKFALNRRSWPVLQYLLETALEGGMNARDSKGRWRATIAKSDEDLATRCFRTSSDPVRRASRSVWHINNQLNRVFAEELRGERWRLAISPGKDNHRAELFKNDPPPVNFVDEFWSPYFDTAANLIVLSTPMFWRKKNKREFFRDAFERAEEQGGPRVKAGWVRNRSFLIAGEVLAAYRLLKELGSRSFQAECSLAGDSLLPALQDNNLIVLGSGRTNKVLRDQQVGRRFILGERTVQIQGEGKRIAKKYADELRDQGEVTNTSKYGILTRFHENERTVTLVGAQHGRAVQGIVEYLTDATKLIRLFKQPEFARRRRKSVPEDFQVIFKVPVAREGGESTPLTPQIEIVAVRVYSSR
jgi:hypothetical protein